MSIRREGHITIETVQVSDRLVEHRTEHFSPPLLPFHAAKLHKRAGEKIPSKSAAKRYMRSLQGKQSKQGKRRKS